MEALRAVRRLIGASVDPGRPVDLRGESVTGREHPARRVKPAGRHLSRCPLASGAEAATEGEGRGRRRSGATEDPWNGSPQAEPSM